MTSTMTIRTDPAVKAQAQKVFADLGMDMTTAINVFLRQAIRYNGFPFEVRNPEPSTLTYSVLDDVKHGRVETADSVDDMFMKILGYVPRAVL